MRSALAIVALLLGAGPLWAALPPAHLCSTGFSEPATFVDEKEGMVLTIGSQREVFQYAGTFGNDGILLKTEAGKPEQLYLASTTNDRKEPVIVWIFRDRAFWQCK